MIDYPINNIERLAVALRKLRRAQQALAQRARVARRTLTRIEGGQNIGVRELCRIVGALGQELVLKPTDTVVFEDLAAFFKEEE